MLYFVYILRCVDDTLYTGITNDVEKRLIAHQTGKGGKYTRAHAGVAIVHTEEYATKGDALRRELCIKQFSRQQKQSLIKGQKKSN